jgi:thiosulfate dehydrogenase (quinone) large subunit
VSLLRRYVVWIAAVAAIILVWLQVPEDWEITKSIYLAPGETANNVLTWAFWILSIVIVLTLFTDRRKPEASVVEVEGPAFARYLFSNTRAGIFWLPIRLFLGMAWFEAGWHKLFTEGWLVGTADKPIGSSLAGFWTRAVTVPEGASSSPITYDWYKDFINFLLNGHHEGWFAYVITFGEMAVGIALVLGALTGIAAFFGALMNMSFLLAGSASSNPVLFTAAIGLIVAWRVAGYYGLDRYLLPRLGTPWQAPMRSTVAPADSTA